MCHCPSKLTATLVGENKYRVSGYRDWMLEVLLAKPFSPSLPQFLFQGGSSSTSQDAKSVRLVSITKLLRILNSTVMVRVGGGWMPLQEFLERNDPCRGKKASFFAPSSFSSSSSSSSSFSSSSYYLRV